MANTSCIKICLAFGVLYRATSVQQIKKSSLSAQFHKHVDFSGCFNNSVSGHDIIFNTVISRGRNLFKASSGIVLLFMILHAISFFFPLSHFLYASFTLQ
jgi:hypothetical protein